jgi:chromosome segregation ATPase
MTYTELAHARGISKSSAERLVFRNHWRRQRGNNGVTRALVPLESLTGDTACDAAGDAPPVMTPAETPDVSPDVSGAINSLQARAISALEDAVATLREQMDGANRLADEAEQRAAAALALADRLGTQLADAGERATRAEAKLLSLEADLRAKDTQIAEQRLAVDQARAEVERVDGLRHDLDAAQHDAQTAQAELAAARLAADQVRTEASTKVAQAEADADRARGVAREAVQAVETLKATVDELKAGQAAHIRNLAVAEHDAEAAQKAAAALRQAEADRKARGRWARLRAAWRGE